MKKISDEIICKVFAQYPKVSILINEPKTQSVGHYLEGIDFALNQVIAERVNYNPQWITLGLKPLSEITDEDAIQAARLCMNPIWFKEYDFMVDREYSKDCIRIFVDYDGDVRNPEYERSEVFINYNGKDVQWHYKGEYLGVYDTQAWYLYLQSKGYDLPNYFLGGKTLFECKLAIYPSSKKGKKQIKLK